MKLKICQICPCFDVSVLLLVVGWFSGARAIPLIGGGVPWLIAQSSEPGAPAPATAPEPSTSRFQATIFAPVMELSDQEGIWADAPESKHVMLINTAPSLQDIDFNSWDITDKLIMLQVEPTQTPSSPIKMSRPWGSFTPGKFPAINQNGAIGCIKPLGHAKNSPTRAHLRLCLNLLHRIFSAQSISVDRGFVSNFHKYETLMKVLQYQLMSFDYFCRWAVFIQFTCWKEKYKVFYENISIPSSQRVWSITFQLLWPSTTMSVSILVSKLQIEQLTFGKYSKRRSDPDSCDKDREGNTNNYTIPDTKYSITSKIS